MVWPVVVAGRESADRTSRPLVMDEGQAFNPDRYELLRLCAANDDDILWFEAREVCQRVNGVD